MSPFTSMLSLDVEKELGTPFDKARLHGESNTCRPELISVVHGMSKELVHRVAGVQRILIDSFCANGLRVGALISQHNPLLLRAMANTSMLMKRELCSESWSTTHRSVSSPADVIFSALLNDKAFLKNFITTNRQRLGEAYAFTRKWFNDRGVEVAHSNA
jgi:1-aminocyclopropane-1-carboxylate synthase